MSTETFNRAVSPLEGQRQEAHRLARQVYAQGRAHQLQTWKVAKEAVAARLEKAKIAVNELPVELPTDPKLLGEATAARQAALNEFQAADAAMRAIEQQPSDRPLRADLDRVIGIIDTAHKGAMNELRVQHEIQPVL